jgi:hypothetical protein
MTNTIKKILPGGGKKTPTAIAPVEQPPKVEQAAPLTPEQTQAVAGAAVARKKVKRRIGQRGLMYASRLGGGGRAEDQRDTLGAG